MLVCYCVLMIYVFYFSTTLYSCFDIILTFDLIPSPTSVTVTSLPLLPAIMGLNRLVFVCCFTLRKA
ncbi:hypothetical protein XELAEV_18030220mg [Xenopus laevis]|uniref:Uncharacterized protein n=1 Tax=Xenopus laevis TaxID=8355 RepID=A0A974CUP9_XENLA|nr:hypothetical protein XELAEV_18030220mg [Xenopus laevis]